jgi:hypothetical protein
MFTFTRAVSSDSFCGKKNGVKFRTDTAGASAESGTDFQLRRTAAAVLEWALRSGGGCIHAAGYVGVDVCLLCL